MTDTWTEQMKNSYPNTIQIEDGRRRQHEEDLYE